MGLRHLREDFIHGTRLVGRAPRLSAFVVAVLGLAQAATVTVFGVVNATLLRPLPGREPEQVVLLDCTYRGSPSAFSPPTFADLRAGTRVFASLSAAVPWDVNLVGGGDPERVHGQLVSADLFATLGVPAWKGRTFVAEDERAGHEHVVLVSHDLWQRRGADPAVLGSALRLNGEPYTVVGVMPPGFRWGRAYGREAVGDVWAPFVLTPARLSEDSRGDEFLDLYARLRPGSTPAQARADLAASAAVLAGRFPDRYGADARWSLTAVPLQEAMVKPCGPRCCSCWARWPCFSWPRPATWPACCWPARPDAGARPRCGRPWEPRALAWPARPWPSRRCWPFSAAWPAAAWPRGSCPCWRPSRRRRCRARGRWAWTRA